MSHWPTLYMSYVDTLDAVPVGVYTLVARLGVVLVQARIIQVRAGGLGLWSR